MDIRQMLQDEQTTVIDVRTREEFMGGNVYNSINIPLQELPGRISELSKDNGNIVLCCASGGRSGIATQLLQGQGFTNVYNGGGWTEVNYLKNN